MVRTRGENGCVEYSQKGVDGGSKWKAGMGYTEVRLDGWCDGGLGQQGDDGRSCARIAKDWIEWRALVHMYIEFHAAIFIWLLCLSDRPPALWGLSPGEGCVAVCSWGKLLKGLSY